MLKVLICEDNASEREDISFWVKGHMDMAGIDGELVIASANPGEVLDYAKDNPGEYYLYFLDIDLADSKMNGLQLGAHIRKSQPRAMIVFVTTHSELMPMTFYHGVEAMDYIIKDDRERMRDQIFKVLDKANERVKLSKRESGSVFELSDGDIHYIIPVDDIYYFETAGDHKIRLVYKDGIIEYRDKLSRIESVDESFFRCHNAYVINVNNVSKLIKSERLVIMKDGSDCLVSTRKLKELENMLTIK